MGMGGMSRVQMRTKKKAHFVSFASHTVEKWPQPSFLTTIYLPSEKASPMWTGW